MGGGGAWWLWEGEEPGDYGRGRSLVVMGGGGAWWLWEGEEPGDYGRGRSLVIMGGGGAWWLWEVEDGRKRRIGPYFCHTPSEVIWCACVSKWPLMSELLNKCLDNS